MKRTRFGSFWTSISPGSRYVLVVCWLFGLVIIGIGVNGDSNGWWSERPFITNLVSSITGALIGIPFALVVLQKLTASETGRAEQRRVKSLTLRFAQDLIDAADGLVVSGKTTVQLRSEAALAAQAAREVPCPDGFSRSIHMDTLLSGISGVSRLAAECLTPELEAGRHWSRLKVQWDFMQDHIRIRLLEFGHRWIDTELSNKAQSRFQALDRPGLVYPASIEADLNGLIMNSVQIDGQPHVPSNEYAMHFREPVQGALAYIEAVDDARSLARLVYDELAAGF